jgi:formylglycine-generating enzyme required for sulfatase activity/serine/threonine protein kinase
VLEGDSLQLVGRTIADKYAVERLVGEGGFATVYRATHLIWKRPVALKVFKKLTEFSDRDRQRLLDEFVQEGAVLNDLSARTAAIVQARDIGMLQTPSGEHIPYMVLEWLEGASLEDVLASELAKGLPPRTIHEAVALLDPAAEALALAHKKGIAHRDVKPGNFFIIGDVRGGDPQVKLLDFGIAKVVSDAQKIAGTFTKTSGQVTSFTPAYGAPEQFTRTHGATGPWTDVFALALVIDEMITGKVPIEGDDYVQLAFTSANPERRPTPRTLGAQVTDEVEGVFRKALMVKPIERWQTAGEFWQALRGALRMEPMRGMTDPMPRSLEAQRATRDKFVSAPTMAAGSPTASQIYGEPPIPNATLTPNSLPSTSTTSRRVAAGSSKAGLFAALGVGALVLVAGGVYAGIKYHANAAAAAALAASASAVAPPSAHPSASAVVKPPAACPAGMIRIPGGSFYMGSDDAKAPPFEKPAHQVILEGYCIDKYETTLEKYKACSDVGHCKPAGKENWWASITEHDHKVYDPLCNINAPAERGKHPVNCVDYDMSEKYCKEQGGRLPTEAEWEFAARGPDGRKYPWGDDDPTAEHLNACGTECVAWGVKNGEPLVAMYKADDGFANTAPVGMFPKGASRYGLEDVVGNVWEWVADWYSTYDVKDPDEATKEPKGPAEGTERVIRGGAWNGSFASWVRPTFRYKDDPKMRTHGIGFRCAK